MKGKVVVMQIVVVGAMIMLFQAPVLSQIGNYFGQNKVLYKDFEWAVFRTEHFDVYYYPEEAQAAHDAARMAERGYDYLSEVLEHEIKERIPLILYASLNDFQQTNVIHGLIGQGTRGVTESMKHRVVMPITGSYREFNHVLVHELVHAFQFDLILRGKTKNTSFNPPLWFVEGMAEYLSIGMDNTTRMWVRDGLLNDNLLTVDKLNRTFDIRVYRLGESLWHYIGENHDKKAVGKVFKSALRSGNLDKAFKSVLKLESKQITERWHAYSRKLVMSADSTLQKPDEMAEKLTRQQGFYHRINLAPAISPDGKNILYIANKNLNEGVYRLQQRENNKWHDEMILQGGKGKGFEELRYFESALTWSRDGRRVAFISKAGKDDALYILDPDTKKIQEEIILESLNGLQSPTFSPAGDQVAFVGILGGISNLYVFDLKSRALKQLTDDRFAVLHPQWSPDGNEIIFVTDKGQGSDEGQLLFGDYDLAVYNRVDGSVTMVFELAGNVTNPQWSPDGTQIAFLSDHQGIPNIYMYRRSDQSIRRITKLVNGIGGISELTPAFSWSANGETLVFSVFEKTTWHLYRLDMNGDSGPFNKLVSLDDQALFLSVIDNGLTNPQEVVEDTVYALATPKGALIPSIPDPNEIYTRYEIMQIDSVEKRGYESNFKLDAVVLGGGYDNYFGTHGQAQLIFSDMMGHHNLYVGGAMQFSDLLHSDFAVTYLNQGHRLNYGLQAFQSNALYLTGIGFNSSQYLRYTYRGFNGIVAYPFSKFGRVELSAGLTWVDADFVQDTFGFFSRDRQTVNLQLFNYAQFGAALVFDNSVYGPIGPMNGSRSRFSVEQTARDFHFTNLFADYRRYFGFSHRSVLALRLMGGASVGRDEQYFFIGGPYTYRGADFNELVGSRFVLSNLEYRFPIFPFLPASFDFLTGAAFFDAAAAWGVNIPGFSQETFQPFTSAGGFRLKDLNAAVGFGPRLNLGYFVLGYDIAWPTDFRGLGSARHQFSIGTFF